MTGPSPHLSWDELACHDRLHTPYPLDWRGSRAVLLAREFEAVRDLLAGDVGREIPLLVHSAYRTMAHNAAVGGSPSSQHLQGRALDIAPRDPRLLDRLYAVTVRRADAVLAIRGVGRYDTFIHMDTRPTAALALWDYRSRR